MPLTRIKNKALSDLLDANGDVKSGALDNVPASDDASALITGTIPDARLSNQVKVVKSGSAPGSPQEGDLWYDTDNDVLKLYDSTDSAWVKVVRVIPTLSSITGSIVNGTAKNLTLTGTGFLATGLVVSFTPSGGSESTVTVTPTSDTAATVAVPSAIYGQSVGTVIAVKVTNSDLKVSNSVNSTVVDLPTGGTVTTSGSYRIHTFTSSGNFNNTIAGLEVEYLVIAGAGGSGRQHGGGGGAGGYRCSVVGENSGGGVSAESKLTLSSTGNKTVTIGAGGAGSPSEGARGTNGNDSVFDSITSTGGGAGGSFQNSLNNSAGSGLSGGSGGGAGSMQTAGPGLGQGGHTGGAGTTNQGYAGGDSAYAGAGGGGAGAVGEDGAGSSPGGDGGNGGAGVTSSITGSSVGRAGGGAGGSYGSSNQSSGSRGIATDGGGNGGWGAESGTNGTANTGGGAGGGGVLANGASSGGSGIVIVRYIP